MAPAAALRALTLAIATMAGRAILATNAQKAVEPPISWTGN